MSTKIKPLGVCDCCGGHIPRDEWITSKGTPRLHCSRECRNTANSRAGAPIRSDKAKQRVADGTWKNPLTLESPESRREHATIAARKGRLKEVAEGRWRNPALDDAAREKLSRPRIHQERPLVHRAMELMRQGIKLRELPADLRAAFNAYQRERAHARGNELHTKVRAAYHRRKAKMTSEQIEQQRAKWRTKNKRRSELKHLKKTMPPG